MRTKSELRNLIRDGQLQEAADAALQYAEAAGDTNTLNGLIELHADLHRHQAVWLSGQISFEELARTQARITQGLLARIDDLPNEASKTAAIKRIGAERYKWLVFYLFIIAKVLVFLYTFFMWKTFGFQSDEALTAFNALLPGLVIYGSIMFKELFRSGLDGYAPRRYVPTRFRTMAWIIFAGYAGIQVFLVTEKVQGNITFTMMNLAMLGVEAGMGRFVSEIVEGIFKKKNEG